MRGHPGRVLLEGEEDPWYTHRVVIWIAMVVVVYLIGTFVFDPVSSQSLPEPGHHAQN